MIKERDFYPANGFRVCIDSINQDIRGRAYSPLFEQAISYEGFQELLLKIDDLFDQKGYPQAFQEKRTFKKQSREHITYKGKPNVVLDAKEIHIQKGEIVTVDVIIYSRRDTSWQGEVFDTEGKKIGNFEGEIELLQLLMKK